MHCMYSSFLSFLSSPRIFVIFVCVVAAFVIAFCSVSLSWRLRANSFQLRSLLRVVHGVVESETCSRREMELGDQPTPTHRDEPFSSR